VFCYESVHVLGDELSEGDFRQITVSLVSDHAHREDVTHRHLDYTALGRE
jgi:hypothetical protein